MLKILDKFQLCKTQSDQSNHQNPPNCTVFSKKNISHQNASIVKCFQKFIHEKYPIASMCLKYLVSLFCFSG